MSKQVVNIIEFSKLFDILYEVNHLLEFEMFNYKNYKDFIEKIPTKYNSKFINNF